MATDFGMILARNIIHVSFGEDLSDELADILVKEVRADGTSEYVKKTVTILDSICIIIDQVCHTFYTNVQNPLNWLYPYTDKVFQFSPESKIVKANCMQFRKFV